jgi:hypothetical protein
LGEERTLILEGELRESSGEHRRPGDFVTMAGGSSHAFEVLPGQRLIYALVLFDAVLIGEQRFPA